MKTLQHTAIYFWALWAKHGKLLGVPATYREFHEELPFVLLPDAIRGYIGPRQASHFEMRPDGTANSWMVFPNEQVLKDLSKETSAELVKYSVEPNIPKCVIGEMSCLRSFEKKNCGHSHFLALRAHMVQDDVLDTVLREEMIDATKRFSDTFISRYNRTIVMDGQQLRQEIEKFENIGFIYLAGKVYEATHELLNRTWFERNVMPALRVAYPTDLADNTFRYMKMSDEMNDRINSLQFEPTEEEVEACPLAEDLVDVLDTIYAEAFIRTLDCI